MIHAGTRNEVTHAQYTAQVCHRKTDALTTAQTMISTLVSDEMIAIESSLSFFLSIWSRLQYDCNDILHWLQHSRGHPVGFQGAHGYSMLIYYVTGDAPRHRVIVGWRT